MESVVEVLVRLDRIEAALEALAKGQAVKDHYTTEEFGCLVNRSEFTVREWCRHGRLHADKKASGRGPHAAWTISHGELLRYQRHGLLALRTRA